MKAEPGPTEGATITALVERCPDIEVSVEPDILANFGTDWSRIAPPRPLAVAFPRTTEEVASLLRACTELDIAVVPSGGRTGLSGGAIAANGELVVSLEKMKAVVEIDRVDRLMTVQAGMVTAKVQELAHAENLFYPIDFAAAGSSHIGGNVATNAGGVKVVKYGMTRDWIAGLEMVLADGTILQLNRGLTKNATGLDLRHLTIGSEGVLGIITQVTVKLAPPPPNLSVMLLAASNLSALSEVFARSRASLDIHAYEFFSDDALNHVIERHSLAAPFDDRAPWYVLIEFADSEAELAEQLFADCFEAELIVDGVISQSQSQAADLWAYREHISEAISHRLPYKNDIAVRPSRTEELLRRLDKLVSHRYPDFDVIWFGHIGDGNLHLNILKPETMAADEFRTACEGVNGEVFALVAELGGSISAEHGIGLLKAPYLSYSRSEAERAIMGRIKAVFDPAGRMNPGKMLSRCRGSEIED